MRSGKNSNTGVKATMVLWVLLLCLLVSSECVAQQDVPVQVKTFDRNIKALPDIEISLDGGDFIRTGSRGVVFAEVPAASLPPKSVVIRNEQLEAESWNYSKGVLEIIVRPKSFRMYTITVKSETGKVASGVSLSYHGSSRVSLVTDANGRFEIAVGLHEKAPVKEQFVVDGYSIQSFILTGRENQIIIKKTATTPTVVTETQRNAQEKYFGEFDIQQLDSIRSLTVFYAVFKNFNIGDLSDPMKRRVDEKFKELMNLMEDSVRKPRPFLGRISDSTFVKDDIRNLLAQAEEEKDLLGVVREEFDQKIQLINQKLSGSLGELDGESRDQLWRDIARLELILQENETRFYLHQADYHSVLSSIKQSFFDVQDLEHKLYKSETQREADREAFQRKILTVFLITLALGIITVMLVYFSTRLRRQQKELVRANEEIRRINENLEGLVSQRTMLLESTNREMDTFLYKASHDLQGPVCSIIGLCNIATRSVNAESLEVVQRMFHAAFSMDKMLKKLKVISEINQPGEASEIVPAEEGAVLLEQYRHFTREHNIDFRMECDPAYSFSSRLDLFRNILYNLVDNALYFTSLRDSPGSEVVVEMTPQDDSMRLSVTDNGPGIPDATRERIWEMFYIGTEDSKGHGLGLYIVRRCVEALNASISLESERGKFTRVIIIIPDEAPGSTKNNSISYASGHTA
jgi:signal transduction histidine kinase